MKKNYLTALLAATTFILSTGCRENNHSMIAGRYEHAELPGQTFEFGAENRYVNAVQAGLTDCTIDYTGTWTVNKDSLIVNMSAEPPRYHFGKDVTKEQQAYVRKLAEKMNNKRSSRMAFRIAGTDSTAVSLEQNGKIMTYTRIKSLK